MFLKRSKGGPAHMERVSDHYTLSKSSRQSVSRGPFPMKMDVGDRMSRLDALTKPHLTYVYKSEYNCVVKCL